MKILFITANNLSNQNDYLEITLVHGFHKLLGKNFIEYPKTEILYEGTNINKENFHGKGFTTSTHKLEDINSVERNNFKNLNFDAVIIGDKHIYREEITNEDIELYNKLSNNNVWYIDGHDLFGYGNGKDYKQWEGYTIIGNTFKKCFKRELIYTEKDVYPTGFGISKDNIMEINFDKKQLFQKTVPSYALFSSENNSYIFSSEKEYYEDISISWFGLTCMKGGWDCMRHYEILACGALLLFRDYNKKPETCSPQNLPCYSYSTKDELYDICKRLVVNNKPTIEYIEMINKQRKWLLEVGTTEARAKNILEIIKSNT